MYFPRMHLSLGIALILLCLLCLPARSETADTLIEFKIEDQFEVEHGSDDYAGKVTLLIGSDKDGAEFNRLWGAALDDSLDGEPGWEETMSLPVANMKGVPFFLKGFIRGKFPQDPEIWVLLDWKGEFAEAYGFTPKASNILIFDADGALVYRAWGKEIDERKLGQMCAKLRELFGD